MSNFDTKMSFYKLNYKYLVIIVVSYFFLLILVISLVVAFLVNICTDVFVNRTFFTHVINGIKNNTIKTYDDIVIIFKEVSKNTIENSFFNKQLSKSLQYALCRIYKSKVNEIDDLQRIKDILFGLKKENNERNPNSDLPDYEKDLFKDINFYLKEEQYDMIPVKLASLATAIKTLYGEINRNSLITRRSYVITIISIILSIFFYFKPCNPNLKNVSNVQVQAHVKVDK